MIAVRRAREEARRVLGKELGQCLRDPIGKLVLGNPVPYIEEEAAAWLKNAARFPIALHLVGKEHRAELARDDVETLRLERQLQSVGLSPFDASIARLRLGAIEHRLIEIGCDDAGLRGKTRHERAGQNAGSCGGL